jgi:hypothetical protein
VPADGPGEADVGQVAGQLGREVAGGQGVDPHAALAPLDGELAGEVDQGAFGGVLGGHRAAGGDDALHGGDVDHAGGGSGQQQWGGQTAHVEHADPADLDDLAEFFQRLLLDRAVVADPGVVDQHIEATARGQLSGHACW